MLLFNEAVINEYCLPACRCLFSIRFEEKTSFSGTIMVRFLLQITWNFLGLMYVKPLMWYPGTRLEVLISVSRFLSSNRFSITFLKLLDLTDTDFLITIPYFTGFQNILVLSINISWSGCVQEVLVVLQGQVREPMSYTSLSALS